MSPSGDDARTALLDTAINDHRLELIQAASSRRDIALLVERRVLPLIENICTQAP